MMRDRSAVAQPMRLAYHILSKLRSSRVVISSRTSLGRQCGDEGLAVCRFGLLPANPQSRIPSQICHQIRVEMLIRGSPPHSPSAFDMERIT